MPMTADEAEMQALTAGPNDGRVYVEFFIDAVKDEGASEKANRPIYRDQEFVKIMIPGDSTFSMVRKVTEVEKRRFPKAYQAFRAGQESPTEGTPLISLPFMTKSQCAELAALGIKTAEQFVNVSDASGQKFLGFQGLRAKVKAFLDDAAKGAPAQKMAAELEKRDSEIDTLKKMLAEQRKRLEEVAGRK